VANGAEMGCRSLPLAQKVVDTADIVREGDLNEAADDSMLVELAVPCRILRRRVLVRRRKRILLRNEAQLPFRFVPALLVLRGRGLSRVEMNALRAPLTSLSAPREEGFHF
jgi:hypothetical protein